MKTLSLSDYTVTEYGEIINTSKGKKLKPQPNDKGYLRVSIGGKLLFVHRLVAEKYIPNPYGKEQVNHKDGNKRNNRADNLEWVTNIENRKHAVEHRLHLCGEQCSYSKLTMKQVEYIRSQENPNRTELAKMFNVSRATINDVLSHRTWK